MNKETARLRISEAAGNFLFENVHRDLRGTKHLAEARAHRENGGGILFYYNHFSKLDSILYGEIIHDYLAPFSETAAIASLRHMDPSQGRFNAIQGQLMKDWEEIFGMSLFPVVQEKDKGKNKKGIVHYPNADKFNLNATKEAIKFLREPGHVLALAPEGERSTTNQLLEAGKGFEWIFRLGGKNVLALPVAGVHSTIRPFNTKTIVSVGKPFSYEEALESCETGQSVTDFAMRRLAIMLRRENQGAYLIAA